MCHVYADVTDMDLTNARIKLENVKLSKEEREDNLQSVKSTQTGLSEKYCLNEIINLKIKKNQFLLNNYL